MMIILLILKILDLTLDWNWKSSLLLKTFKKKQPSELSFLYPKVLIDFLAESSD